MITSTSNKILIFFILTVLFSLLIQLFQESYSIDKYVYIAQLVPGIVAIIMIYNYEELGVGSSMLIRRIRPTVKPKVQLIFVALLPLILFPAAFFIYRFFYNPYPEIIQLSLFALLWPIVGAFAEELGWRGYMQNKAGTIMHMFIATLLTGAMWFFGRAYLFVDDIFLGITYFFLCIVFNFILTFLFFMFNRNILLTYVFQLAYSYMFLIFATQAPGDERLFFILVLLSLIPASIILFTNRRLFQIENRDDTDV